MSSSSSSSSESTSDMICKPLEPKVNQGPTCDAWEGHQINLSQLQRTYKDRLNASLIDHTGFYNELVVDYYQEAHRRDGIKVFDLLFKKYPKGYLTILDSTRYLKTVLCAADLHGYSDDNRLQPCPLAKGKKPLRKLCMSTCESAELSFRAALMRHVGDAHKIPHSERLQHPQVKEALSQVGILFKSMCQPFSNKENQCVASIKLEESLCGFAPAQIDFARQYCRLNSKEDCCTKNASALLQEHDPPVFLGMPMKTVVGVSIGVGVALVICILAIICLCKKRNKTRTRPEGLATNISKFGKSDLHIEHQQHGYSHSPDPPSSPPRFSSLSRQKPNPPTAHTSMMDYSRNTPVVTTHIYNNPTTNPFARDYPPHTRYHVTADYNPEMQDELELRIGDMVYLTISYPDGWGYGRNETTGLEGVVPLGILRVQ